MRTAEPLLALGRRLRSVAQGAGLLAVSAVRCTGAIPPAAGGSDCARCTAPATRFDKVRRTQDDFILPLCDECHAQLHAQGTRALAIALSAALLGTTAALTLPLLWTAMRPLPLWLAVVLVSALPLLLDVFSRRTPAGAASYGYPVVAQATGYVCLSPALADKLAALPTVTSTPVRVRVFPWPPWVLLGLVPALLATSVVQSQRPLLRVVNLSGRPLEIMVDERIIATLDPTSSESPNAGGEYRVASGQRRLRARDPHGQLVSDLAVGVQSGGQHLYAPASEGTCFWLEEVAYGRQASASPKPIILATGTEFWALPTHIDTWFAANPEALEPDFRSSGGRLTALRQGPCNGESAAGIP